MADYDTVVIYHGGCPDGIASAWAFSKSDRYGRIIYYAASERIIRKDSHFPYIVGKTVFIVDFSYSEEELTNMRKYAKSVTVLDHHITSKHVCTVYDATDCGAGIVWNYLYGKNTRPWFLTHIRDRDLWLWEHPRSKDFSGAFFSLGLKFDVLDMLYSLTSKDEIDNFYKLGELYNKFTDTIINNICVTKSFKAKFQGYDVIAVQADDYISEIGSTLCNTNKDMSFALVYRYATDTDEWKISLRGTKEKDIDLSSIASRFYGGGHKLSCAFKYKGDINHILTPLSN